MKARATSLSKGDYELLAEFRCALRRFLSFSEGAAAGHGLAPQQYQALLAIEGFPGRNWVHVGELAGQLQIAHHSAVGLVDRLERLGMVRREQSSADRRKVCVSLTRAGRKVLEKLYRVHRAELRSTGPRLAALLQKAARQIPEEA
ncbi:MAG: MarR family winged helix-turn-helix transcriptional regulator [Opitutaceae bacterium]